MKVYEWELKNGITRTKEFEKKGLATYAVNCGLKCGHGCKYCSTGAMLRTHKAFKKLGLNPFGDGYAIVDPDTPQRIIRDACRKQNRGLIQLCTTVDPYSPEAQQYNIGRQCLEVILSQPGWTVRILTKNAAVANDFDVIKIEPDRVLLGMSITATPDKAEIISVIEPNASSIPERIAVMKEAHKHGFRTYGMFCPLLPGIADSPDQIEQLIKTAVEFGVEEIFVEPVNPRGPGLKLTQQTLADNGYLDEAAAIESIRTQKGRSQYTTRLISNVQRSVRKLYDIDRLRFLLYPSRLTEADVARIRQEDAGVIWLGRNRNNSEKHKNTIHSS